MFNITEIKHPEYSKNILSWNKFRSTFVGGEQFVDDYLVMYSLREGTTEFERRKKMTYCPAHAKAAVIDIKNSIYQRLPDIIRYDGPSSYVSAISGADGIGVDRQGGSMTGFIGRKVLPELLSMGAVGVFVDRLPMDAKTSRVETKGMYPYLYIYKVEDIRSFAVDTSGNFTSLLLRDTIYEEDPDTGLIIKEAKQYRLLRLTSGGVTVELFDARGIKTRTVDLNLRKIPFVLFQISHSLLIDVADYQVALLNLASSDMDYAVKSNFPFYVEQYNPATTALAAIPAAEGDGTSVSANKAKNTEIKVGVTQGRRYPVGQDRPAFIHPSSEPLKASMDKQRDLQREIRMLVNLSLMNLDPNRASEGSRELDNQGLESGLSYIGMELETGERALGVIWADYEASREIPMVNYPTKYSLLSDSERREEAKELREEMSRLPSLTYQKTIAKRIASVMLSSKIPVEEMEKIHKEIDSATVVVTDPTIIKEDHEAGFIGTDLASEARGYPKGEVEKAKADHAERAIRIAAAQSSVTQEPGARGVDDLSADDKSAEDEKDNSQDPDLDENGKKKVRGAVKLEGEGK